MAGKRLEHLQPEKTGENPNIRKFQDGVAGLEHEFAHAYLILISRFLQKVPKAVAAAGFVFFKKLKKCVAPGRYLHTVPRTKINRIRRIHANQFVVILHRFAKEIEKRFKYFRHPVPAGTHIKNEAIDRKLSCSPTRTTVFF